MWNSILVIFLLGSTNLLWADPPEAEEPGDPDPIPGADYCYAYEFLANGYWKEVLGDGFHPYDSDNPSAPVPLQTLKNDCSQDMVSDPNDPPNARCFWMGLAQFPITNFGTVGFQVDPAHTGWTIKCTATRVCCINEIDEVPDDDPVPVPEP